MLRVDTLEELFLAAQTLSRFRGNRSTSLTIFGNGAGPGVIAADAATNAGVDLTEFSAATQQQLDALLPPKGSHGNPIDLLDDAPVARYEQTLKILLADHEAGAMLFIHAPTAAVASADIAKALAPLGQAHEPATPRLMSCWLGEGAVKQARQIFQDAGIANFDTPEQAVSAFSMLLRYWRNQAELTEAPPALLPEHPPDTQALRTLVRTVLSSGRETLTWLEVKLVLEACHIPVAPAHDADSAATGRVRALELMLASRIDPVFGPVIVFGQGGSAMEILADKAVALPPLNIPLAKALVSRTRVSRLLGGWGDTPAVDEAALHGVMLALSQLMAEIPEIAELEINPLLASSAGAVAHAARIRLRANKPAGADNFAIRPYPAPLEETLQWQGRSLTLRPIRPEDEAMHMAFLQQLDPEDVRMRVFYSKRTMARSELARLVQIDYAREMAFVALARDVNGPEQTLGVVRAIIDPDNLEAEFGVIVSSALKGRGLGLVLMQKMIAYLRTQGTQRLVATVLDYNTRMLKLAEELGFETDVLGPAESGTRKIVLTLT
jgi:RimJ/RimL family protein N-acetyltransferase